MVGAGRADLNGELRARAGAELVGMHPRAEPAGLAGPQDRAALVDVEGTPLAEHVDPSSVRCAGVQHRAGDLGEVGGAVDALGDDVRAEERRLRGELRRDPQRALLGGGIEAVAGFRLEGRDARVQQLAGQPRHVRPEQVVVGRSGGGDGGADPTGRVRLTRHAGGELRAAVTGEDQVRVRVDEPGQDAPPTEVEGSVGRRRDIGRSQPADPVPVQQDRGVGQFAHVVVLRREQADATQQG